MPYRQTCCPSQCTLACAARVLQTSQDARRQKLPRQTRQRPDPRVSVRSETKLPRPQKTQSSAFSSNPLLRPPLICSVAETLIYFSRSWRPPASPLGSLEPQLRLAVAHPGIGSQFQRLTYDVGAPAVHAFHLMVD